MKMFRTGTLSAVVMCSTVGLAGADISPAEVWQEFQDLYGGFGIEISGTATPSGADLVISEMTAEMANPSGKNQPLADAPMEIPYDVTLRDLGDGTVELILPDELGPSFQEALSDIEGIDEFEFEQSGLKTIISGEVGDMNLTYSADQVRYLLKGVPGETDNEKIDMVFDLTGIVGNAKITQEAVKNYLADFTAANMDVKFTVQEGDKTAFDLDMTYTDLTMINDIGLASNVEDMEDILAMMKSGFAIKDLSFAHKGMRYTYAADDGFPISGEASSQSGTMGFALTEDGFRFVQSSQDATTDFSGIPGMMPPMEAEMASFDMDLLMPLVKSETPKDYTVQLSMQDLTMGEQAWAMFDPTQELPRDPINVSLTATGQANVLVDIFQEEEPAEGEPEGQMHSLSLSDLLVQFAGAELTGQGDFTFDNTDLVSFDGMPRPEGELDLKLTGGNTLIDKLVSIGLLQQEQVMGARMMMAIFTNQVEGEDTMTSKLVVDEAGSVFANGQQIK